MTEERIKKIEDRLDSHEAKINCLEKQQMSDTFELKTMITDAVNKAIKPLINKIEEQGKDQRIINEAQDKRITALENAEAQKALKNSQKIWDLAKTIMITALATIVINNAIDVLIYNNSKNSEVETHEVTKTNEQS